MEIIYSAFIGIIVGTAFGWFFFKYARSRFILDATEEANDLIQEAKDNAEIKALEEKERIQEIEMELWTKVENDMLKLEEHIEDLENSIEEKKNHQDLVINEKQEILNEKKETFKKYESSVQKLEKNLHEIRHKVTQLNNSFIQKLSEKTQITKDEAKKQLIESLIEETTKRSIKVSDDTIEEAQMHSETRAKRILALILDRFHRPYSSERGIGAVNFPDAQTRKRFCDEKSENIKAVQNACGCDLIIEDDMEMVGVAGFDPVRRELTRRSLERIFKEKKQINPEIIHRIIENQKKELFRQIKSDGDNLAKELKLEGLHPEIRQMMGSLRYRYSFTQNQYFHCGEVGWLAGLLASELGLDIRKARRMGMLHDIGKAMDHQLDGGHAVIGADFIQSRNEAPEIVHAVRSHHYDEQPSTDHAFLVIAADAISGSRPGARRSTIESYNQKVSEMQEIARSFEGVTDCFVLSGGRECRVMVNSKKVDDANALVLSQKIARKIEEECNYPGQIKVVVVRETVVSEHTKKEQPA